MLAEEVRKGLVIDDLPLTKADINKLFTKKRKVVLKIIVPNERV